jgi:hypothetical protein
MDSMYRFFRFVRHSIRAHGGPLPMIAKYGRYATQSLAGDVQVEASLNSCLFNPQRLHQLQKIFRLKPEQLGGGGAVTVGRGKSLQE